MRIPRPLADLPLPAGVAVAGAVLAGVFGCLVGLIVGLRVYPRTAWFATFEVGIPSAVAGFIVGLAIGGVAYGVRWMRRDRSAR